MAGWKRFFFACMLRAWNISCFDELVFFLLFSLWEEIPSLSMEGTFTHKVVWSNTKNQHPILSKPNSLNTHTRGRDRVAVVLVPNMPPHLLRLLRNEFVVVLFVKTARCWHLFCTKVFRETCEKFGKHELIWDKKPLWHCAIPLWWLLHRHPYESSLQSIWKKLGSIISCFGTK